MPPKKGGDGPKPPPLIGRFGTSLKIGIVGLPNVGWVSRARVSEISESCLGVVVVIVRFLLNNEIGFKPGC